VAFTKDPYSNTDYKEITSYPVWEIDEYGASVLEIDK
jgi:hypothetical protein